MSARDDWADELERAWLNGEISHADACAEMAEMDGDQG